LFHILAIHPLVRRTAASAFVAPLEVASVAERLARVRLRG
jgi:hypothetical protein